MLQYTKLLHHFLYCASLNRDKKSSLQCYVSANKNYKNMLNVISLIFCTHFFETEIASN